VPSPIPINTTPAVGSIPAALARNRKTGDRREEEEGGDIGCEDPIDEEAGEQPPAHRRQAEDPQGRRRRGGGEPVISQQWHDMRGRAVDPYRNEEKRRPQHPKARRARGLTHGVTGEHCDCRAAASLAFAGARLTDPGCHCRERNDERHQPEADIGAAPADTLDQLLSQLRHDKGAEPDTRHRDAERQPATPIEPGGDRLGIAERRLDRAGHLGKCEHQNEDPQHGRSEPH